MTTDPFPFQDINTLEETGLGRSVLFESLRPQNLNPFQQRQFSNLFEPTFNNFLGQLGEQVRGGQSPSLLFNDFLKNQFDPQRQLLQFGTGQRAPGQTAFRF